MKPLQVGKTARWRLCTAPMITAPMMDWTSAIWSSFLRTPVLGKRGARVNTISPGIIFLLVW